MNERSIFLAALDIADPAKRAAYLAESCGADANLRRQVEALLAAHDRSGDFLDVPALQQMAGDPTSDQIPAMADIDLSFLKPPTSPGSLGRLGNYEIHEVLGRGGCGIVFKAFDERLNRAVAIKVLAPELAATSPARKRFVREAQAAAAIRHENVVAIHDVGVEPIPFLVMEYIAGKTLQQKLDATGPLDWSDIVRIGRQIALGMQAAHAIPLVHRDIKPGNVLVEAGTERVKLTDFGLARAGDDASLTQSGMIAGTPLYMSPEQASGATIDPRSDLFSLGSVLYVMASGRPPFRASTTLAVLNRVANDEPRPIREIIPEVPEWLVAVIAKLHAKKPGDRYGSAQEVAEVLGRGGEGLRREVEVGAKRQAASVERTRRPRRRWAAAALVFAAILGGLGMTEATGVTDVRGTVIRLLSPDGTLVVEVDDPGVSVRIDGEEMVITGAGIRELRLRSGPHTVEARKDGKLVRQELVTVARNGRQVVRVSREPGPAAMPPVVAAANIDPDRRAAEWILSIRGTAGISQDGKYSEFQAGGVLPRGAFRLNFAALNHNPKVTDAELARLQDCKDLGVVTLHYSRVSDAGLVHLNNCTNLINLSLAGTDVSDAGLVRLTAFKNLRSLDLGDNPKITDAGIAVLAGCPKLGNLYLKNTQVTEAGTMKLQAALPKCQVVWDRPDRRAAEYVLSIGGVVKVNGAGEFLRKAAELPPDPFRLTQIDFPRNLKITVQGWDQFRGCKNVTDLILLGTPVLDEKLANFKECKGLTVINLDYTGVGDAGMAAFKDCSEVRFLGLHGARVTDAGLAHLKEWKTLRILDVRNTKVTDAGLANFQGCKDIERLDICQTRITDAGLALFKDCKNLRILGLTDDAITDAGLALFDGHRQLTDVFVGGTEVTDVGVAHLRKCRNLSTADFNRTKVTEAGLAHLKECPLQQLNMDETVIGDQSVDTLSAFYRLKFARLKSTKLTEAGIKKLAAALPFCRIEWNGGVVAPKSPNATLPATSPAEVEADRRAAEYILSIGGNVKVNGAGEYLTKSASLPSGPFRLTWIDLPFNRKITDKGWDLFRGCGNVTDLILVGTPVLDEKLAHFKGCKGLATINLDNTGIGDAGLAAFKDCTEAQSLCLQYTRVTDAGLAHLKEWKKLKALDVRSTKVTDAGLANLQGCKELERLHICHTRIPDAGLAHFKDCKNLAYLDLIDAPITDAGLAQFEGSKQLTHVIADGTEVTDAGLAHLKNCRNLTQAQFGRTKVTEAGLAHLKDCALRQLYMDETALADQSVDTLSALYRLKIVSLKGTKLTEAGIRKLAAALPFCRIEWNGGVIEPKKSASSERR